jgi:NAD dependent epimerase/dehydratase
MTSGAPMDFASFYRDKRVYVTGADGFIGSHLVERLVQAGASVTALVLYNSFGRLGWLGDDVPDAVRRRCRPVLGDIRDEAFVRESLKGHDMVFHLAALIGIPYSYTAPFSYVDTNTKGTLHVLEAARSNKVARVVHTSTSEVYGTAVTVPIHETHSLHGQSPYAASKIAADVMAEAYHRSFGLPVVTLRPFNTYGPRQSERAVIPTVIKQLLAGAQELRLGRLDPRRDFNYVTDTVEAFLAVGQADNAALGGVYNAGTGCDVSIGDVVAMLARIVGAHPSIVEEAGRVRPEASEVMRLQADATRLAKETGWAPRVSLEDGLRRTVEWWRQRQDGRSSDLSYTI